MAQETYTGIGTVMFYKSDKGWGGVEGADLLGDVWVHFSVIEMDGFRTLEPGQRVDVTYRRQAQDSWQYVADRVRPLM